MITNKPDPIEKSWKCEGNAKKHRDDLVGKQENPHLHSKNVKNYAFLNDNFLQFQHQIAGNPAIAGRISSLDVLFLTSFTPFLMLA